VVEQNSGRHIVKKIQEPHTDQEGRRMHAMEKTGKQLIYVKEAENTYKGITGEQPPSKLRMVMIETPKKRFLKELRRQLRV